MPGTGPGTAKNNVPGKPPGTTDAQVIDLRHVVQQPEMGGEVAAFAASRNVGRSAARVSGLLRNRVAACIVRKPVHATYAKYSEIAARTRELIHGRAMLAFCAIHSTGVVRSNDGRCDIVAYHDLRRGQRESPFVSSTRSGR